MEENNEKLKILTKLMGEEAAMANINFDKDISDIENKHLEFFKVRPSKNEIEPHDRLKNHFMIWQDQHEIVFVFNDDCDLPSYIKIECFDAFGKRFKEKESNTK